ncbi:MAG: Omp28-related outer membrane protein, partial [Ignavibacteriaceae bacterium]
LAIVLIAMFAIFSSQNIFSQTQRNPVLEEVTGTWCVWCPCGHTIMSQIKAAIPNAIMIGYHGPANGSDPFSYFSGNSIMSSLGYSAYPTGIVDRVSGIQSRSAWLGLMNNRNTVPATVAIDVERSFNELTREFNATIDFTALANLNGQFKFNVILLEDGIVWNQAGNSSCPGDPNYVHKHVVRDMMNGALGEEIINGAWNENDVITKTVSRTIPLPGGSGPDMVWDNCNLVVMVYKVGSPLSSNGEIQQAVEMVLKSPDYVATITTTSPDFISENNSPSQFTAMLHNEGLLIDTYDITASIEGPAGWTGEFTTVNGTFQFGEIDSVQVSVGDSTEISVTVNPNSFNGSGVITVECASKNDPGTVVQINFNLVTNTGVHLLVVDATGEGYSSRVTDALDAFYEGIYGVVSRSAFQAAGLDLSYFTMISWSAGTSLPAFYPEEVNYLESYLDQGGNLLINGQNIGSDIFEAGGQSQFAQSFFNNYLHANYVADSGPSYFFTGYTGDPITDGISFSINAVYTRSPDEISPFDANTSPIIKYGSGPAINSVKADDGNYKVVFFGIGLEQIDAVNIIDSLVARSVRWLTEGIVLDNPIEESVPVSFTLEQNYPNPFNPATTITYSIPKESQVSLKIYDVMGREIVEVVNSKQSPGSYNVEFDAASLASGTYFYKLTAGEFVSVKKMVLLK